MRLAQFLAQFGDCSVVGGHLEETETDETMRDVEMSVMNVDDAPSHGAKFDGQREARRRWCDFRAGPISQ